MRVLRGVFVVALLAACRTSPDGRPDDTEDAPVATTPAAPSADLETALARISAKDLEHHIAFLASDAMKGRATPSPELDDAARHIANAMAESGVSPAPGGKRRTTVPCGAAGERAANVVGIVKGSDSEVVLITAHYDHVGLASSGDDRVFNGANDNASGVAAMLEIADALAHAPTPPRRTLAFVAFCGEEHGMQGSKSFVADPAFALPSIVAVLNLEMLGHPDPEDPRRAWVTGHDYSSLRAWLDRAGAAEGVSFVAGKELGHAEGNAFDRSDNYSFAVAGVVAHTIAAGPIDEHYHAVSDEAERIDTQAMVPLVRALGRAAYDLANAHERPQWSGRAPARFTRPASRTSAP